jgi:predicted metalloprotease
MRLEDMRESENVEDRTGMGPAGGGGFPIGGGGMKLGGGALILIVIVSLLFGINPMSLLSGLDTGPAVQTQPAPGYGPQQAPAPGADDPAKQLARKVLGDTEDVWSAIFKTLGGTYAPPRLVLFPGRVQSACGIASEAAGPFYCPGDQQLYLDTSFFDELARRFRAPGDFAQAYVIAHEVGHHVQNLTGTMRQFDVARQRLGERGSNALSVRLELQADCYAGVWGYYAQKRGLLDPGDLEEGLAAATAVGDDRIQRQTQGYVVPDSFTHGSGAQRQYWFKVGFQSGDMRKCDTFNQREP